MAWHGWAWCRLMMLVLTNENASLYLVSLSEAWNIARAGNARVMRLRVLVIILLH